MFGVVGRRSGRKSIQPPRRRTYIRTVNTRVLCFSCRQWERNQKPQTTIGINTHLPRAHSILLWKCPAKATSAGNAESHVHFQCAHSSNNGANDHTDRWGRKGSGSVQHRWILPSCESKCRPRKTTPSGSRERAAVGLHLRDDSPVLRWARCASAVGRHQGELVPQDPPSYRACVEVWVARGR